MAEIIGKALIGGGVCVRCNYPFETASWVNIDGERVCHDCATPAEMLRPGVSIECDIVLNQRPIGKLDQVKHD